MHCKQSILQHKRGFTLIEMIVTLGLITITFGVMYGFFLTNFKLIGSEQERMDLHFSVRSASDRLAGELKSGAYIEKVISNGYDLSTNNSFANLATVANSTGAMIVVTGETGTTLSGIRIEKSGKDLGNRLSVTEFERNKTTGVEKPSLQFFYDGITTFSAVSLSSTAAIHPEFTTRPGSIGLRFTLESIGGLHKQYEKADNEIYFRNRGLK